MSNYQTLPVPRCGDNVNFFDFLTVLQQRVVASHNNIKLLQESTLYYVTMTVTQELAAQISKSVSFIEKELKNTLQFIHQLKTSGLEKKLAQWKREQQLFANGHTHTINIDIVQKLYDGLAEVLWATREQIKQLVTVQHLKAYILHGNDLLERSTQLLSALVTSSFIIDKQPTQVIKKNTRFAASVRFLAGKKIPITPPSVTVTLISEAQANDLLKKKHLKERDNPGEIVNNTGVMGYQEATKLVSASFKQMQVTNIRRPIEHRGTGTVKEQKCCLHFSSEFQLANGELLFKIWTLSVPVVVVVHGSQEASASATITWDNAFSKPERFPFEVPNTVTWGEIASILDTKFKSSTGRGLSEDHLKFLGQKLFKSSYFDASTIVSWSQFAQEHLPNLKFSFYEWFFMVMKLTKDHLRDLWKDGNIIGFIEKETAQEILQQCSPGTFLLRFSDSNKHGAITIAFLNTDGTVYNIVPLESKDLQMKNLADRIRDLHDLVYLYPYNTHKQMHFQSYYTSTSEDVPPPKKGGYSQIKFLPFVIDGPNSQQCDTCRCRLNSTGSSSDTRSIASTQSEDDIFSRSGSPEEIKMFLNDEMDGILEDLGLSSMDCNYFS